MPLHKTLPGNRICLVVMLPTILSLPLNVGVYAQAPSPLEGRYVVSSGFTLVQTPALHMIQKGFQLQAGRRIRPWMVTGFDFSKTSGTGRIDAAQLPLAIQKQIGGGIAQYQAAGLLPGGYRFQLPNETQSCSFSLGPQMTLRLPHGLTLLGNPAVGALRERTTPQPADGFQAAVIQQAIPSGTKLDWTPFFGATSGVDVKLSQYVGVKAQLDAIHSHPFNDLLARGNWSYRYTFGITLRVRPVRGAAIR